LSAVEQSSSDHPPVGAREAAELFEDLAGEARLLVAVSGGPDSVALLALLADWSREPGRPCLLAATVDHGLRPSSADEAQGVAALCARLGVVHRILHWEGDKPRSRLQERARAARYALLAAEAENAGGAALVTAHTLDDQAETLLMRMARGSGPSGLAGMRGRVRRGGAVLVRPLLSVPKARLIATAQARGLPFVEDPSNGDPRFARARWRTVMPLLAAEGLDAERLSLLAGRLARLDEAAAARARAVLGAVLLPTTEAPLVRLNFAALRQEPDEIVLRVVAASLERLGAAAEVPVRLERLETCVAALCEAARASRPVTRTLAGAMLVLTRDGTLALRRERPRRRGIHPAAT
jgi:tRNA(Ile)-lysidine synthase